MLTLKSAWPSASAPQKGRGALGLSFCLTREPMAPACPCLPVTLLLPAVFVQVPLSLGGSPLRKNTASPWLGSSRPSCHTLPPICRAPTHLSCSHGLRSRGLSVYRESGLPQFPPALLALFLPPLLCRLCPTAPKAWSPRPFISHSSGGWRPRARWWPTGFLVRERPLRGLLTAFSHSRQNTASLSLVLESH